MTMVNILILNCLLISSSDASAKTNFCFFMLFTYLRDDKNADVTSTGEGVLWVKSPSVATGYFRDPVMSAERFVDGWFNTGDYVRVKDGYVRDRKSVV